MFDIRCFRHQYLQFLLEITRFLVSAPSVCAKLYHPTYHLKYSTFAIHSSILACTDRREITVLTYTKRELLCCLQTTTHNTTSGCNK